MSDMMSQGSPNSVAHNGAGTVNGLEVLKGLGEIADELGVGKLEAKKAIENFIAPGSTNSLGKVWDAPNTWARSDYDVLACVSDKCLVAIIAAVFKFDAPEKTYQYMTEKKTRRQWVTIYGLKVDEAHQGKKLGERLLLICMLNACRRGQGELLFSIPPSGACHRNVDACIIYHKCGWSIEGAKCEKDKLGDWLRTQRKALTDQLQGGDIKLTINGPSLRSQQRQKQEEIWQHQLDEAKGFTNEAPRQYTSLREYCAMNVPPSTSRSNNDEPAGAAATNEDADERDAADGDGVDDTSVVDGGDESDEETAGAATNEDVDERDAADGDGADDTNGADEAEAEAVAEEVGGAEAEAEAVEEVPAPAPAAAAGAVGGKKARKRKLDVVELVPNDKQPVRSATHPHPRHTRSHAHTRLCQSHGVLLPVS